jgi:hypothetical protein
LNNLPETIRLPAVQMPGSFFLPIFSLLYTLAYICSPDFFIKEQIKTIWHEFWYFYKNQPLISKDIMKEKEGSVNFVLGVLGLALILIFAILLLP